MLEILDSTFEDVVTKSKGVVMVDFWAPWCGPCRAIAQTIEKLSEEFKGKATIAKVNVDENQGTAELLGIMSIPTLIVFKDGVVYKRLVGAVPEKNLRQLLEDSCA